MSMLFSCGFRRIVTLAIAGFVSCFTYSANATVTFVGTDASPGHIVNSGTSTTVTPPTHTTGDVFIIATWLVDANGDFAGTVDGLSGGTNLIATFEEASSLSHVLGRLDCIVATSSAMGDQTVSVSSTIGSSDVLTAGIQVFRSDAGGFDCATILAHSNTSATDLFGNIDTPSLTITTDNTAVMRWGMTASDWASVAPPSGDTEAYEYSTAAGADVGHTGSYQIQTTATNLPADEFVITTEASAGSSEISMAVSLQEEAGATAPTITSALDCNNTLDVDGFNCTVTVDEDSTGHAVACPINSTAPTAAQIKLGDCTGDVDAIEYETTSLTGTMAWSAHFTGLAGRAVYDVYFIATNAGGDSAIGSDLDSFRLARTGYEFITLTSIGAGTWCAQANTANYWDNAGLAIAIGDVLEIETATSPSAFAVTNGVDCGLSYSGNGSRQTVSYCPLDATDGANFADPMLSPSFYEGCDDLIVFNNSAPQGSAEPYIDVWLSGATITDIDLDTVFSDGDGDSMTYEVTTGTLPTGVSLSTNLLTGTPTTSNYPTGVSVTITAYDSFGGSGTQDFDLWVYDAAELTMPDLTDGDINDAISDELATMPWREDPTLTTTFACDESVASDTFISQDPAATTEIEPDQTFSGVVSTGECYKQRRGFGVTFPGVGF